MTTSLNNNVTAAATTTTTQTPKPDTPQKQEGIFPGSSTINKKEKETGGNSLSGDAFMQLFLEQLRHQDPTAPMDTKEILSQTAQLSQVEAQEKMKTSMDEMTKAMQSMQETNAKTIEAQEKLIKTQEEMLKSLDSLAGNIQNSNILDGYNTVGMIGKIAETGYSALNLDKNDPIKFSLYFDKPIDASKGTPKITIIDKDNNVIREIPLNDYDKQGGYIEFEWDTKDGVGQFVKAGEYKIKAEYNLDASTNKYLQTELGRGEVQSVMFEKGIPYLKLGEHLVVPIDAAHTFYPKA